MSRTVLLAAFLVTSSLACEARDAPPIPLRDGTYTFAHRYAEHPNMRSFKLTVTLKRGRITVLNRSHSSVFPKGVLEQGRLHWHSRSGQWIIAHSPSDESAQDAGGCSDGPTVVDLKARVYWTC